MDKIKQGKIGFVCGQPLGWETIKLQIYGPICLQQTLFDITEGNSAQMWLSQGSIMDRQKNSKWVDGQRTI